MPKRKRGGGKRVGSGGGGGGGSSGSGSGGGDKSSGGGGGGGGGSARAGETKELGNWFKGASVTKSAVVEAPSILLFYKYATPAYSKSRRNDLLDHVLRKLSTIHSTHPLSAG
jgi:hypothetical protein